MAAAVEMADTEGIDAMSMRALARKLGVGTMSLYRYVPSKNELLPLMLDCVVGPTPDRRDAAGGDWRHFLTVTARHTREIYLTHPWTIRTNWSRPVLGPSSMDDLELFIEGVRHLPLSDREIMNLATSIDSCVLGTVRQQLQWTSAAVESGMSDEEFWETQGDFLGMQLASGRFPLQASLDADAFDATWDASFDFGLQLIIHGVEVLISSRPGAQQPPASCHPTAYPRQIRGFIIFD